MEHQVVKVRGRIGLHSNLTVWLNTEARLGPPWENCLLQTSTYPLVTSWLYIPRAQFTSVLIGKDLILGSWWSKIEVIQVLGIYSIVFSLSKTVLLWPVVVLLAGVVGGTASMGITVLWGRPIIVLADPDQNSVLECLWSFAALYVVGVPFLEMFCAPIGTQNDPNWLMHIKRKVFLMELVRSRA